MTRERAAQGRRLRDRDPARGAPADHAAVIGAVDAWWGGRRMADMLPRLFFVHSRPTSFVAEAGGVPYTPDYDGPAESRVLLRRVL